jgi:hypothetical protein
MKPNEAPHRQAGAAHGRRARSVAAALAALLLASTAAGAQEPSLSSEAPPQDVPETLWQFGEHEKFCLEWTDDCRVCRRVEARQIACSNVAIACLPKPLRCTLGGSETK